MSFIWIPEQEEIRYVYGISGLVSITDAEHVYCAVRAESLNVMQFSQFWRDASDKFVWFSRRRYIKQE